MDECTRRLSNKVVWICAVFAFGRVSSCYELVSIRLAENASGLLLHCSIKIDDPKALYAKICTELGNVKCAS